MVRQTNKTNQICGFAKYSNIQLFQKIAGLAVYIALILFDKWFVWYTLAHFYNQERYLYICNFEKYQLKHCQCMDDSFNYQKQKVVNTHHKSY